MQGTAVLGLALTATVSLARAQPQPSAAEPPSEYTLLVDDAVREYNYSHWAEARALFKQAHALQPNARTERGLGLTSFELRHYVDAVNELQSALDDGRNALSPTQRNEVSAVIERARRYVGAVRVELEPADATLLLNGTQTDKHDLVLDVGDYELSAKAPGYQDASLKLSVEGGQSRALKLRLVPAPVGDVPKDLPSDSRGTIQRVLGWSAVGLGAVGLAVGAVFELQRSNKLSDRDAICPSGRDCTADDQSAIDHLTQEARTASTIGIVGLISGVALAGAGVVALLTVPGSERPAQVSLSPMVGRDAYGALLTARSF